MNERKIEANGIRLHLVEQGEGPLVLFLHGWPESWYSWRHQLAAVAAAGYHAVAIDVRGYGQSDAPHAIEAYAMKELVADAIGVLDALGEKEAVVVGHDWGSAIAWTCAALHPERFRAVVGMSVPHLGRSPAPPTTLFRKLFAEQWFYILYFQEPGVAEAELEADYNRSVRGILAGHGFGLTKPPGSGFLTGLTIPTQLPPWLTEEDVAIFAHELARHGFRGPLNRYRNMDRDWEELPELATKSIEIPALFVIGDRDPTGKLASQEPMKKLVPDLEIVTLEGAGHWIQQERPGEVNATLLAFLARLPGRMLG